MSVLGEEGIELERSMNIPPLPKKTWLKHSSLVGKLLSTKSHPSASLNQNSGSFPRASNLGCLANSPGFCICDLCP